MKLYKANPVIDLLTSGAQRNYDKLIVPDIMIDLSSGIKNSSVQARSAFNQIPDSWIICVNGTKMIESSKRQNYIAPYHVSRVGFVSNIEAFEEAMNDSYASIGRYTWNDLLNNVTCFFDEVKRKMIVEIAMLNAKLNVLQTTNAAKGSITRTQNRMGFLNKMLYKVS